MAKLTAPLLSLSASGSIAGSITYGTWKGVKYARQRVIPANPNTANQQTQRGYITTNVSRWHSTVNPLNALDKANLDRGALYAGRPMSGFNLFCLCGINTLKASVSLLHLHGTTESAITASGFKIVVTHSSSAAVKIRYGVSPTALITVQTRDEASTPGTTSTFTLTGLSATTKYYYRVYNSTAYSEEQLGIGQVTTTA